MLLWFYFMVMVNMSMSFPELHHFCDSYLEYCLLTL